MDPSNSIVIETNNLGKTYKGVEALQDLNLTVQQHSIFGFLGPNGAGKTTTIKLLLGLSRPTGGSGKIFGSDIQRDSISIRKRIGYLAQDPRYYEHMTARETLRFTAHFFYYTDPKAAIEKRIQETLQLVGLEDKADRPVKGFSGGERQRLGIAQAQVNYPDLLILDEPAASLDPQGRHDVLEVMERLRKHTTIFYSTHILSDVQRVSDTVAILDHGKLISQAPIEELLNSNSQPVFTLALTGETEKARQRLSSLPWVAAIQTTPVNNHISWQVTVTDETIAVAQLLPLVLSGGEVTVLEFGRQKIDLEDIFLTLTEGVQNGKHN
ncbi:MAG TPA: ABC transporter ATP-binding protein [Anaerolineales bacterium]